VLKPTDHQAAAVLDSQVQERLWTVERATAPIYRQERNQPVPNGSAVMLRLGNHRFAVTAAHVADTSATSPLYIGSARQPVRLEGTKIATRLKPGQRRTDDPLDVAVLCLSDTTTRHFRDEEFIDAAQIDAGRASLDDEIFLVAGYPGTKRRDIPTQGTLEVTLYPFLTCSCVRAAYPAARRDPARHIILGFSKKRLWRRGVRVIAPNLHEMSGCGVWSIHDQAGSLLDCPRLAGLLTEWHRDNQPRLVATRIEVALSAIWTTFPELRPDSPAID
jgi:hypothetical protein